MNLRPLQDRVLIRPERPAERTASGLVLAEHRKPEQTGTVVAVGPVTHPRRDEAFAIARRLEEIDEIYHPCLDEAASILRELVGREPEVKVGDYVVFSWSVGSEIWVEDGEERYLMMHESDILCVVEGVTA